MRLTIKIKPDGSYIASGRSREGVQIAYIVGWAMRAAREIVKEEEEKLYGKEGGYPTAETLEMQQNYTEAEGE